MLNGKMYKKANGERYWPKCPGEVGAGKETGASLSKSTLSWLLLTYLSDGFQNLAFIFTL